MENEIEQGKYEESGLSLRDILYIVRKHLIVIIAIIVAFTGAGYIFSKYQSKTSPEYVANATMMVTVQNQDSGASQVSQYQLSYYLTDTFEVFMTQDIVLGQAVEKLNAKLGENGQPLYKENEITLKLLQKKFTAKLNGNSLVMNVSYTDDSKAKVVDVLNTVMETAVEVANTTIGGEPKYKLLHNNLAVLTPAEESRVTLNSKTLRNIAIFFAIGFVVAVLYVLLRELTNNKFKDTEEIERLLGFPVLAGVVKYEYKQDEKEGAK